MTAIIQVGRIMETGLLVIRIHAQMERVVYLTESVNLFLSRNVQLMEEHGRGWERVACRLIAVRERVV